MNEHCKLCGGSGRLLDAHGDITGQCPCASDGLCSQPGCGLYHSDHRGSVPAPPPALTNSNQRMWDLVRYMRHELHEGGLITDEEFAELVKDHAAVQRLEDYAIRPVSALREKLEKRIKEWRNVARILRDGAETTYAMTGAINREAARVYETCAEALAKAILETPDA